MCINSDNQYSYWLMRFGVGINRGGLIYHSHYFTTMDFESIDFKWRMNNGKPTYYQQDTVESFDTTMTTPINGRYILSNPIILPVMSLGEEVRCSVSESPALHFVEMNYYDLKAINSVTYDLCRKLRTKGLIRYFANHSFVAFPMDRETVVSHVLNIAIRLRELHGISANVTLKLMGLVRRDGQVRPIVHVHKVAVCNVRNVQV